MIEPIVAAAIWAVVASLVIAVVLGGLAFAIVQTARPAAATRHVLWIVALFVAGIAPVAIVAGMAVRGAFTTLPVQTTVAAPGTHTTAPALPVRRTGPSPARDATTAAGYAARTAPATHGFTLARPALPGLPHVQRAIALGVGIVWMLGALAGLAGLVRSIIRVRGLKARSSPLDGTLAEELPWLTASAGREIYLRLSYEIETPIAIGFRRPVILIPTEMATADGLGSIEALVMHEYAHLVRYDDWTNFAQRTIERIFWFNPLVWVIGRRIALEREVAADEAVIARTHDPKNYAATLWQLAREMRMPEHVSVAPGAMLTRKQISIRIERLLEETPINRPRLGAAALALAAVGACGVAAIAATAPPLVIARAVPATAAQTPATATPASTVAEGLPAIPATAGENVATERAASPAAHAIIIKRLSPQAEPAAPAVPAVAAPPAVPHDARKIRIIKSHGDALPAEVQADLDAMQRDLKENLGPDMAGTIQRQVAASLSRRGTKVPSTGALTRDTIDGCTGCDLSDRDLHGVDLSGMHLTGMNLSGANLSGANLSNTRMSGVNLERANLTAADLRGARLMGVGLNGANFTSAKLEGTKLFGASINGVILGNNGSLRSIVDACNGCDFSGMDFHDQDLHGVASNAANFAGANFSGANLRGANLRGANLEGADLSNADLTDVRLSGANLRGASLAGAKTTGMHLYGTSLP